jgi:AhpD family alkylhydroperoxidase
MSTGPARLEPVFPAPPELERLYARLDAEVGKVHNFFSTTAHNPLLLQRIAPLAGAFLQSKVLPERERELVILRVAWRTRCVYEFGQHALRAHAAGLSTTEIRGSTLDPDDHPWPAGDAALIAMADELFEHDDVTDATWADLSARWDESQLVELLMLAGYYRMVAGFLKGCRVEPEAGAPGWPQ